MRAKPFETCLKSLLVLAALLCAENEASANGINPPRPAGGVLVRADCFKKGAGTAVEIYRAQVGKGSRIDQFLEIRMDGETEEMPLGRLRSLQGLDKKKDAAGFVRVLAKKADESDPIKAAVRVSKDGSNVLLIGFKKEGDRTSIKLSECSNLVLNAASGSEAPPSGRGLTAR